MISRVLFTNNSTGAIYEVFTRLSGNVVRNLITHDCHMEAMDGNTLPVTCNRSDPKSFETFCADSASQISSLTQCGGELIKDAAYDCMSNVFHRFCPTATIGNNDTPIALITGVFLASLGVVGVCAAYYYYNRNNGTIDPREEALIEVVTPTARLR